mmetsp:Transcript_53537/g.152549  ORF Transcript_53537/g.152549 Transcript_53537/m.152549 type:complete len:237 (+) Transcript_53537:295-1005(+)
MPRARRWTASPPSSGRWPTSRSPATALPRPSRWAARRRRTFSGPCSRPRVPAGWSRESTSWSGQPRPLPSATCPRAPSSSRTSAAPGPRSTASSWTPAASTCGSTAATASPSAARSRTPTACATRPSSSSASSSAPRCATRTCCGPPRSRPRASTACGGALAWPAAWCPSSSWRRQAPACARAWSPSAVSLCTALRSTGPRGGPLHPWRLAAATAPGSGSGCSQTRPSARWSGSRP